MSGEPPWAPASTPQALPRHLSGGLTQLTPLVPPCFGADSPGRPLRMVGVAGLPWLTHSKRHLGWLLWPLPCPSPGRFAQGLSFNGCGEHWAGSGIFLLHLCSMPAGSAGARMVPVRLQG